MDALEIRGDKHNVVYMWGGGKAAGGKCTLAVCAGLQTGHGFDGGGEGVAGGVVSQVKPMSSDMSFKQQEKRNDTSLQLLLTRRMPTGPFQPKINHFRSDASFD